MLFNSEYVNVSTWERIESKIPRELCAKLNDAIDSAIAEHKFTCYTEIECSAPMFAIIHEVMIRFHNYYFYLQNRKNVLNTDNFLYTVEISWGNNRSLNPKKFSVLDDSSK